RSRARRAVHAGAGRRPRGCERPAGLRQQDGRRRHPQVEVGGLQPAVAEEDRGQPRRRAEGRRGLGEDQQGMEAVTPQEILETADLVASGVAGDEVRRRMHGARTTFVRVLETHVDAPLTVLPPGAQCGEIRIIGAPPSLDAAVKAVGSAKALAGDVPVTGFSVANLLSLGAPADTARALVAAGLSAIAHLPIDLVDAAADV